MKNLRLLNLYAPKYPWLKESRFYMYKGKRIPEDYPMIFLKGHLLYLSFFSNVIHEMFRGVFTV